MVFEDLGNAAVAAGQGLYEGAKKIGQGAVAVGRAGAKVPGKVADKTGKGLLNLYEQAKATVPKLGAELKGYAMQAKGAVIPTLQDYYNKGRSYYQQGAKALGSWYDAYLANKAAKPVVQQTATTPENIKSQFIKGVLDQPLGSWYDAYLANKAAQDAQRSEIAKLQDAAPLIERPLSLVEQQLESAGQDGMGIMPVDPNVGAALQRQLAQQLLQQAQRTQRPQYTLPTYLGPTPVPEEPQSVFLLDNRDDTVSTVLGDFRTVQEAEAEVAKLRKQGLPAFFSTKGYIDNLRMKA